MPDQPLRPASRPDILFALSYALRFNAVGKPHRIADPDRLAERLLEGMEKNGLRIMYQPDHTLCATSR
jgi:aspartate aminotransferase-like enzyme